MKRLQVIEGTHLVCSTREQALAERALTRLRRATKPRIAYFEKEGDGVRVTNLVGTVRLDSRTVLDVTPKTAPESDWMGAVVDLMLPERISVSGNRDGARSRRYRNLTDAVAAIYADRLESALRRNGPLEVIRQWEQVSGTLRGKLLNSRWTRTQVLTPHKFPVNVSGLTVDNEFASAIAFCADVLARDTGDPSVAARLRSLSAASRPGKAPVVSVNPLVARRELPQQWSGFGDTWAIAASLLSGTSLLGRHGSTAAFDVATESWPLLETFLRRSIDTCAALATGEGRAWSSSKPEKWQLLKVQTGSNHAADKRGREVKPDGLLLANGAVLASFEAKYRHLAGGPAPREHVFQAITTAAALGAPYAVLVYPESRTPAVFDVLGHSEGPNQLLILGFDLFGYRKGAIADGRAMYDALLHASVDSGGNGRIHDPVTRG